MVETTDQEGPVPPPAEPRANEPPTPMSSRIFKTWWIVAAAAVLLAMVGTTIFIELNRPERTTRIGVVGTGMTGFLTQIVRDEKLLPDTDKLEWVEYPGPEQLNRGLANADIQVNVGASAPAMALQEDRGGDVKYIGTLLLNTTAIVARTSLRVPAPVDLPKLKIGWFGPNTGGGIALYVTAERTHPGLFDKLVLRQYPPPQLPVALRRGDVDAILTFEPFVTKLIASGEHKIIYGPMTKIWREKTRRPLELAGIAVSRAWLEDNRDLAAKIHRAYHEAIRNVIADPETYIKKYAKELNLTTPAEIELAVQSIPATLNNERQDQLDDSIVDVMRMMAADGLLSTVPYEVLSRVAPTGSQ